MLPITSLYAGILALILLALSLRVSLSRGTKTLIGDGGNEKLQYRIRAQANFIEYVPIILIMMLVLEPGGMVSARLLHGIGITLVVSRLLHGFSLSFAPSQKWARAIGAMLTYLLLLLVGLMCVGRGAAFLMY